MFDRNGYLIIKNIRIFGAKIFVHWTSFLGIAILGVLYSRDFAGVLIVSTSIFVLLVVHESGHALIAKMLGHPPSYIHLQDIRGFCVYEYRPNFTATMDHSIIAWGGVLAQLTIAIPTVIATSLLPKTISPLLSPVIYILGYFNLVMVAINLIPAKGLDGYEAWKLVGFWYKKVANTKSKENNQRKSRITRIK
jgi:Zn-dependent protease